MLIEGNLLIGILIVVALVICAIGVYLRFAARKEQDPEEVETGSFFGRFLKFGNKDEGDEEEASDAGSAGASAGGLTLPPPAVGGNTPAPKAEPEKKSSLSVGGMFSGLLGGRKNKDQIKEEVQAIDAQLNSVLQETEEINVTGLPPQISADESILSDGRGMRELDMEMGALQGPLEIISPEELNISPPALDMTSPVSPTVEPMKPAEDEGKSEKKPDAPKSPVEAEASKPQMEIKVDDMKGGDLLDDLEASSKQEEVVDLSIMKEFQDMPITCVELEGDLKGILDQITINTGRKSEN